METMMWDSGISRKRLLQNITLLWTLRRIPEEPRENILSFDNESTYRLTAQRESEIVSNLAFLSATVDDYTKIMAVCIEEGDNGEAITIRIASNTGDLSRVQNGFMRLGGILEQAARRGNLKDEDKATLLREIVKFDILRILSRLRSLHAKKTWKTAGKQALILQLNTALNDSTVTASYGIPKEALEDLRDRVRELFIQFTKLESLPVLDIEIANTQEIVIAIVTTAHELTVTTTLSEALRASPLHDPGFIVYLTEALGKLGRYYTVASELVCAARDQCCRVFLTVRVKTCQIEVPIGILAQRSPISIHEAVDCLFQSPDSSEKPKRPIKWQLAPSPSQSEDKFREAIAETSQHGKVHAEIQLVFFYELHPRIPRPRIISSSKSACYLCNLFIQLHGQFSTPRTHGRLYEKWILPDWLEGIPAKSRQRFGTVVSRMNAILEDKIRVVYSGTQKLFLHPNESVLIAPAHWPSTSDLPEKSTGSSKSTSTLRQQTIATPEQVTGNGMFASATNRADILAHPLNGLAQQLSGNESRSEAFTTSNLNQEHGLSHSKPSKEIFVMPSDTLPSDIIPSASSKSSSQLSSKAPSQFLIRGDPVSRRLSYVNSHIRISTTSIHATILNGSEEETENMAIRKHRIQLRWLQPNEQVPPLAQGASIVHLSNLEAGQETVLKDVNALYLCHAGDVVEMKYCPDEQG